MIIMIIIGFYLFNGEIDHLKRSIKETEKICDDIFVFCTKDFSEILDVESELVKKIKIKKLKWEHDFSKARNFAISTIEKEADNVDWIFSIDSDECLDPTFCWKILSYVDMYCSGSIMGFRFDIVNNGSRWLDSSSECTTAYQRDLDISSVRLFRANSDIKFKGRIRESVDINPSCSASIPIKIYHHAYRYTEEQHDFLQKRQLTLKDWVFLNKASREDYIKLHNGFCQECMIKKDLVSSVSKKQKPLIGFYALHFSPPLGGAERSMANYFEKLSEFYDINVFCFLDDQGNRFPLTKTLNERGYIVNQCADPPDRAVFDFIKSKSPNLIITQLLGSDIVIDIAKRKGIPCVYFVHGFFEDICQHYILNSCQFGNLETCDFGPHCENALQYSRNASKYNNCHKILCNSEYSKKIFLRFFPQTSKKICVVPPNFKFSQMIPENTSEELNQDKKRVLVVNSMPLKGRDIVLEVADKNRDIEFVFIDYRNQDVPILSKFNNIVLKEKVPHDEMVGVYNSVDAVMVPTLMLETFGAVVCESVLCGKPVVCSNRGNLSEFVKDGKNGFLITGDFSEQAWSAAIRNAFDLKINVSESRSLMGKYLNESQQVDKLKNIINESIFEHEKKEHFEIHNKIEKKEEVKIKKSSSTATFGKKKKILFFAKFFYPPLGGGEYFILHILQNLNSIGYDAFAICYTHPKNQVNFSSDNKVNWNGVDVYQTNVVSPDDVAALLKEHDPDLVITQSYDAPAIVDIAKNMGIKTILGTHFWRNICDVKDKYDNMLTRPLSSINLLVGKHRVFKRADELYVNSDFMRKAVNRLVGIDIPRIIYPIADISKSKYGVRNPKYITFVNPDYGKGGDLLLGLSNKLPHLQFLCVGLGAEIIPQNRAINKNIRVKSRGGNIKLIEKTEDMASVYGSAKILLVPSLVDETFSMVTLEAMGNGVPIIASPMGNIPSLLGGCGILLDPYDAEDWEQGIRSIFNDGNFYNLMSRNAYSRSKDFSSSNELNKFIEMVKKCIGEA